LVLLIAIGTSAVFAQKVGDTVQVSGQSYRIDQVNGDTLVLKKVVADIPTFNSIPDFKNWLNGQPANTPSTAYNVKLNVNALGGGGNSGDAASAGNVLITNGKKYVNLDLSGTTCGIGFQAFTSCVSLVSIILPNNLTRVRTPLLPITL